MAKRLSRAKRLGKALETLRSIVSDVEMRVPSSEEIGDELTSEQETLLAELNNELVNLDLSEVEELRDEIQSWRENIEEKLSHTQKYSDLQECEDTLTNEIDNVQGIGEADDFDGVNDMISDLNNSFDEMEGVSFPSMFG